MDDLFIKFLKEYKNTEVLKQGYGFLTYQQISDTEMYWEDIYVDPEWRNHKQAYHICLLALDIAKKRGITTIYGSADPSSNMFQRSTDLMFKFGFKLHKVSGSLIIFKLEI